MARVLTFLTFVSAVDRQRALDDVQGQKPSTAASMTDGTPNGSPGAGRVLRAQVEADDTEYEPPVGVRTGTELWRG